MENINTDDVLAKLRTALNIEPTDSQPQEADEKTKLEQQALNNTPYSADYYNEALQRVDELKKYCQSRIQAKDSRENILADIDESVKAIMSDYHKGVEGQIEQLKDWQNDYINYYENSKQDYDSPEVELLRRQDWDSKINSMDDSDLEKFIKELSNPGRKPLSTYEVNSLLSRVKDNSLLLNRVKSYRDTNHIGSEWEKTAAWQQAKQSLAILNTYKDGDLLYNQPEEGQWISNSSFNPKSEALHILNNQKDEYGLDEKYDVAHHQPVNIFEN